MEETAETLNNLWQLNYTLLNDQGLKEEPQEKKNHLEINQHGWPHHSEGVQSCLDFTS